jgi:hypothetical protein
MNRRSFLIKGIGAAIAAGLVPSFLPRLLLPPEPKGTFGEIPSTSAYLPPGAYSERGWFINEIQGISIVNNRSVKVEGPLYEVSYDRSQTPSVL